MKLSHTLWFVILFIFLNAMPASAQMWNGVDTLYGNEWINYDQSYFKITVQEDNIYRLTREELSAQGVPDAFLEGRKLRLYRLGEEVPLFVSTDDNFGNADYIEFFGERNRTELDNYLFRTPEEDMLSPRYSYFNDASAYFLTATEDGSTPLRYANVANNLSNPPAKEAWFEYTLEQIFNDRYIKQTTSSQDYNSQFEVPLGFSNVPRDTHELKIDLVAVHDSETSAKIEVRLTTMFRRSSVLIDANGTNYVNRSTVPDFTVVDETFEVPVASEIDLLIGSNGDDFNNLAIAHVLTTYRRNFDFENTSHFVFEIAGNNQTQYLEISNFNADGNSPILYDLTNNLRIETEVDGNLVKVVLPAAAGQRKLVLAASPQAVRTFSKNDFVDYFQNEGNFIIVTHPKLYDDGEGNNWIEAYADYRNSTVGGGFDVEVVEIQQIYDQFGYGIDRHQIALRNFNHFVKKNWREPAFVFIIGKGREFDKIRTEAQLDDPSNESFYVPTFGYPGSDMLLVMDNNSMNPILPLGRLPVQKGTEIRIYLDKIKTFEANVHTLPQTIEDRAWMKKALHLGGGQTTDEQRQIKVQLEGMENIAENNKFGAQVTGFYKTSTDVIADVQSSVLTDLINEGLSILTFFGHSSPNSFDFRIDRPENFENIGKYPLMSSYGCYSGKIHQSIPSIGEEFVFAEERGAIGFYASVGQAYISPLGLYGREFYRLISEELYGQPVGKIHQAAIRAFLNENEDVSSSQLRSQIQQTTYQGDPSIRINPLPAPDYVVDKESVELNPSPINIRLVDSISLKFDLVNIGRNDNDFININIQQKLPNGEIAELSKIRVQSDKFRKSVSVRLPVLGDESLGLNTLLITVDADDEISELPAPNAENNNKLVTASGQEGLTFFVFSNNVLPLYPVPYSIISEPNPVLKSSAANVFETDQRYVVEIDTTALFNSALKKRETIAQNGGVIKWQPNLNLTDETVYYWRVSPDSVDVFGYLWQNSSFLYKSSNERGNGWNQSHYYQFQNDNFQDLTLEDNREFAFETEPNFYQLNNGGRADLELLRNNSLVQGFTFGAAPNGVYVFVFDGKTGQLWENPPGGRYGSTNNNDEAIFNFSFGTRENDNQRQALAEFLTDSIPDGSFVALATIRSAFLDYQPEVWAADTAVYGTNLFRILEGFGATEIRNTLTEGANPYIFFFRKGDADFEVEEKLGEEVSSFIQVDLEVRGRKASGTLVSVPIGPARSWNELVWESEEQASAKDFVQVYGIDEDGESTLIFERVVGDTSLASIDAAQYPRLQLQWQSEDETLRKPSQLDFWRVFYNGVPEAALNRQAFFELKSDTLQQGEPLQFSVGVENISDYDMDSLLVHFTIRDANNNEILRNKRLSPLPSNDTLIAQLNYDTKELTGLQRISIDVNPDDDQLELTHLNNVGFVEFFVETDERAPVLDVTFDGIHIMDGDIVAPNPTIVINLEDENRFLELRDTSTIRTFLILPDGSEQRVNPSDPNVQFFPANSADDNKARLEFKAELEEGAYQLIVKGRDETGNASGRWDYRVDFQVIKDNMISNVLNYPNPFSTSTQFVYTLTGQIPAFFKIQILSVSGRVIREITQAEIGQLNVGTHRTDFAWDGTDEYGDKLANGVYLYRIVAQDEKGDNYENFNNNTDAYFAKGFGKMVILR